MDTEIEKDEAPAKGYLAAAGLPAGLLLALGSRYVLKRTSTNEVYQREAPETLSALEWLEGAGFAIAAVALMVMIWSLRKIFWRKND
jgi:hypothetical protein